MSELPPPAIPEEIPEPAEPGHHLDPPPGEGGTSHDDAVDRAERLDEPERQERPDESWIGSDVP
jgi:hypothetical protein